METEKPKFLLVWTSKGWEKYILNPSLQQPEDEEHFLVGQRVDN